MVNIVSNQPGGCRGQATEHKRFYHQIDSYPLKSIPLNNQVNNTQLPLALANRRET